MPVNPYARYQQQAVMTMTQGELLIKLFDGLIKQLNASVLHIEEKDFSQSNTTLQKSQKILEHLRSTLDHKYDISNNLDALYDFFIRQCTMANVKKDAQLVNEIIPMVTELRDTFAEAERLTHH